MTSKLETIIEFVNSTPGTGGGGESGGGASSGGIEGAVSSGGISPLELASYQSTGAAQTFDILGIAIPSNMGITYSNYSINKAYRESGSADWRWLRSPGRGLRCNALDVNDNGNLNNNYVSRAYGLSPCFCL